MGNDFTGNRNHLQHMQKRDSKSFDSGSLYRPEVDDDSNGTSSMERMERNDTKIMLPTPPIRKSPAAVVAATASATATPSSANQSENHNNTNSDRNKIDTNNTDDDLNDSHNAEKMSSEPNEVRACIKFSS